MKVRLIIILVLYLSVVSFKTKDKEQIPFKGIKLGVEVTLDSIVPILKKMGYEKKEKVLSNNGVTAEDFIEAQVAAGSYPDILSYYVSNKNSLSTFESIDFEGEFLNHSAEIEINATPTNHIIYEVRISIDEISVHEIKYILNLYIEKYGEYTEFISGDKNLYKNGVDEYTWNSDNGLFTISYSSHHRYATLLFFNKDCYELKKNESLKINEKIIEKLRLERKKALSDI